MLTVKDVSITLGKHRILDHVSFSVNSGELLSIVGESGCGKTTLIHIIMGLLKPDSGSVCLDGVDITALPVPKRGIGVIFQNISLFPNMTVLQNVVYPIRKGRGKDAEAIAKQYLDMVGLSRHLSHKPHMLSGGQIQKVALARMLALNKKVLLLDEPFSALDPLTRDSLREELRSVHRALSMTTLYVTHDIEEAVLFSDKILVLHDATVQQVDSVNAILHAPANDYVKAYIAEKLQKKMDDLQNLLKGRQECQ